MGGCSVHVVLLLAAAAVAVVGVNIDGDPIVEDSANTPSIVIQVWGTVGSASTTDQTDIETNRIPQKKKPPTLRKLIPNYDFPVVPVVVGKSPRPQQSVVYLCRRPPRPLGWSWRVWARRGKPRFNIGDKMGPLSAEQEFKEEGVVIGGKLGGQLQEKTTPRPHTKHVDIGRALEGEARRTHPKHVNIGTKLDVGRALEGEEDTSARRTHSKHVNISAKLGEVLMEGEEVDEAVDEEVTHP